MTARKAKTTPDKGGRDWIEVVTGRIGKIAALVAALGGLVLLVLNQSEQIRDKFVKLNLFAARPCVEITGLEIPATVAYADWDNMRVTVRGRNNCDQPLGLYVTFLRRAASEPRLVLRVPHEDLPECRGTAPVLVPRCWDPKKPIAIGKGEWKWETLPPPLTQLSEPRATETIWIRWDVRSSDEPDKPPLATDSKKIEVTNDAVPR